jgi:ADP-ribose pyrophosphatase
VNWSEYKPVNYTAPKLLKDKPSWADPENPLDIKNWNKLDGEIDRRSHVEPYRLIDGIPLNPVGRTGVSGRGQLGKWGVNHAADPVVTRWKRDDSGKVVLNPETNKPVLQFVSIKRLDTNEWAIPGVFMIYSFSSDYFLVNILLKLNRRVCVILVRKYHKL